MSEAKQFHPFAAVGKPTTPLVAVPPVPTFILKAAVPLFAVIDGVVPNPELIVGAVALTASLVESMNLDEFTPLDATKGELVVSNVGSAIEDTTTTPVEVSRLLPPNDTCFAVLFVVNCAAYK